MKEVKTPRKPLAIYYALVLLMLLLLNFVLLPWMEERQRLARCLDFFHRISSSVNGLALSVCFAASSPKGRAFDKSVRGLILSISLS